MSKVDKCGRGRGGILATVDVHKLPFLTIRLRNGPKSPHLDGIRNLMLHSNFDLYVLNAYLLLTR